MFRKGQYLKCIDAAHSNNDFLTHGMIVKVIEYHSHGNTIIIEGSTIYWMASRFVKAAPLNATKLEKLIYG
jgi:hypothetical protein